MMQNPIRMKFFGYYGIHNLIIGYEHNPLQWFAMQKEWIEQKGYEGIRIKM
jgi:hypothetical protein